MQKNYDHQASEDALYERWESSGKMLADQKSKKKPFVIPLPPPNVTGTLHLGHAAMLAIEDILIRYKKMTGHESLWIPGTDHAAIATESVVIKHLGLKSREELSREDFLQECRKFAQDKHDGIVNQMKKMGAWMDWSREAYTFDEARNHGVNTIFKQLYEDGLIERGYRLINWSTNAQSVLSDDELEWEDRPEPFYYIQCGEFIIGTVRSETKCADSPVVVHPEGAYVRTEFTDAQTGEKKPFILSKFLFDNTELRKKVLNLLDGEFALLETFKGAALVGQSFEYKTYAGKRKFWVIADEVIDMEKGTGAMTISSSHSADDYDLAKKHGLKDTFFQKLDFNGKMTELAGPCAGMQVAKARKKSAEIMREQGLLVGEDKTYVHRVPLCYRTGCVVEPMISPQWFVMVEKPFTDKWTGEKTTLKKLTADAVREGPVKIIPERFKKVYFHWIDNLQDWCISRQIWWGHRIPVWYDQDENIHLPQKQKIIFARHGQTDASEARIIQRQEDPLNSTGVKQAEALAEQLREKGITKIISGSTKRAFDTAKIVADALGIPVEIFEEFNGVDYGAVTGEKISKEKIAFEHAAENHTGETVDDVYARIKKGWEKIQNLQTEGAILLVGVRSVFSVLEAIRAGRPAEYALQARHKNDSKPNGYWGETTILRAPVGDHLRQDEDTLDTWFSSALWPFSTLGWPDEETDDFTQFYPTDVLETGWDILFFWVARMIMFGRYATGKYPFHTVYLHGLVTDEHGKKMSKSKGNGIDPLEVIADSGADAVRLSLVIGTSPGNPIPLGKGKISGYRNFVNKLWNAGRFVQMQTEDSLERDLTPRSLADRWILSRFAATARLVREKLETYEISAAGDAIYHFVWDEFCDWYIEASKVEQNTAFMAGIFAEILKLVHPLCPFVTEKLWEELFGESFLIDQGYPALDFVDTQAEEHFELLQTLVTDLRRLRADKNINPKEKLDVTVVSNDTMLEQIRDLLIPLGGVGTLDIQSKAPSSEGNVSLISGGLTLSVSVPFDAEAEKKRLTKTLQDLDKSITALEGRLNNKGYTDKAPTHLVEQTRKELDQNKTEKAQVEKQLQAL